MGLADSRSTRLSKLCMDHNVACQLGGWCSLGDPVAQGSPGDAGRRPAAWSSVLPTGTVTTCVCTRSVSVVACASAVSGCPTPSHSRPTLAPPGCSCPCRLWTLSSCSRVYHRAGHAHGSPMGPGLGQRRAQTRGRCAALDQLQMMRSDGSVAGSCACTYCIRALALRRFPSPITAWPGRSFAVVPRDLC